MPSTATSPIWPDSVNSHDGVEDGVTLTLGVADGVTDEDGDGVVDGVTLGLTVGVTDGDGVAVVVAVAVGATTTTVVPVVVVVVVAELSRENANLYTELDKPVFILFQDPDKKDDKVNAVIKEVSTEFRAQGAVAFTWINSVELKSFQEHVGVESDPAIAIYEFKGDMKYIFSDEFNKENLSKWVKSFIDGKLSPTTKSEEIPEKNDEPVKVVVGKSWETIVEDESKDVLIEQYAPWCGHCKKLAPILDELATDLSGVETLVIAKMDATKNDAPVDYKAQGYPTLHFFPAGSKKGVPYTGGRDKDDFVKFLQENCTHKEGIKIAESEDKKDEPTEDDDDDAEAEAEDEEDEAEDEKEEL